MSSLLELTRDIEVFIVYASEDRGLLQQLKKHLATLKRQGRITNWDDGDISAGTEIEREIDTHLGRAGIILLLVSPDFLASDHCNIVMTRAMERHESGEARVIPIILRHCDWKHHRPLDRLRALPANAEPIVTWQDHDKAFLDVVEGIRNAIEELNEEFIKEFMRRATDGSQTAGTFKTKEQRLDEGYAYYNEGDYERALAAFEQALRLDPRYTLAYYNKGITLRALRRNKDALSAFERAIQLNPNYVDAYIGKGNTLYRLRRYKKALEAFGRAIQLDPNEAISHNGKGGALYRLGRHSEAVEAFGRGLQLSSTPLDALTAYIGKGRAFLGLKLNQEALESFERALQLDPGSAGARTGKREAEVAIDAVISGPIRQPLWKSSKFRLFGGIALAFLLILPLLIILTPVLARLFPPPPPPGNPCDNVSTTPPQLSTVAVPALSSSLPPGIIKTPAGEYIGISNGNFAFDTNRVDGQDKLLAADELRKGHLDIALSYWDKATREDTSDAEAKIYQENQHIAGQPYVTFVIGTPLTGNFVTDGRDALQGAYLVQKEYDEDGPGSRRLPNGLRIRLLVANSGSADEETDVGNVANLIVREAQTDDTFMGVMGWNSSKGSIRANEILAGHHIPLVSPTASSDLLTRGIFRIAPSNKAQAVAAVSYAEQTLKPINAALFIAPDNVYSENLGEDFQDQLKQSQGNLVVTEQYEVGHPEVFCKKLEDAFKHNPNLLYFPGYSPDARVLLDDLSKLTNLPAYKRFVDISVMGGDDLYQLAQTTIPASSFGHLSFTSFAYHGEWGYLNLTEQQPSFFQEYPRAFNPYNDPQHRNMYGYTIADYAAMLAYDAMTTLVTGYEIALNNLQAGQKVTPSSLQQALVTITGSNKAIQGVGGQISFREDGSAINKAVVVLYIDPNGLIKLALKDGVQGCFLVGPCSNP